MKRKSIVGLPHQKKSRHGVPKVPGLDLAHFKEQGEPFVFDFKKLLMAFSEKEAVAQSDSLHAFMENCAKPGGRLGRARINSSDDVWQPDC